MFYISWAIVELVKDMEDFTTRLLTLSYVVSSITFGQREA